MSARSVAKVQRGVFESREGHCFIVIAAILICWLLLSGFIYKASGQSIKTQTPSGAPTVNGSFGGVSPEPQSIGIAYSKYLWPKVDGVATIYYVIDPNSDPNATPNIQAAINTFNSDFSGLIQWVEWTSSDGPNYVDINLNANDYSGECEAVEGYQAEPAQPMGGSTKCTVTTILHEMGHVIGLWHEQSRPDRNTYVTVNYNNVIKGSWSNFEINLDNQQLLTPYDYASVMQYPSSSFSRNGGPVIETIPAGIPLNGTDGVPAVQNADYSAADKEGIERLYGAAPTAVTVTSNPVGLQVIVDGETITTPQTFNWALNSMHTLNVPSGVQTLTGDIANSTTSATFYYTYGRWNDSTSQSHTITVTPGNGAPAFPSTSPQVATYSANFIQLVPYSAGVYPSGSGTVSVSPPPQTYSGNSGQFFVARQQATLTASPATGWNFYEFNNAPYWLPGGLGANPKTFYIPDTGNPVDVTTEFSNTPIYTVDVSPDPFSSNLYAYVDGGFVYTPKNFSSYYDSTWTFGSTHTLSVDSPEYPYSSNSRYAFSSWNDGGAQSHSIASLPGSSTSYIATMTPQFAPATNFSYPPCGGTATLSPNSPTNDGFYPTGQSLQFTATPDSGWTFAGWTYDITGTSNPASLTANDETLVFANFNTVNTPLTLTGVSPSYANAGGAALTLTITGTGFSPSSLVSVNGTYRTVTYVNSTTLQVPITAADIATPATFQIFVENYPSGWTGCAVFGYDTFVVEGAVQSQPPVTFTPASLTFPTTNVGSTSVAQTVTVKNTGTSTLFLNSEIISGTNASSFLKSATSCGTSLAVGSSCTVSVQFKPAAEGSLSASLSISDSATGSPQTVALNGTGGAPVATFSPTSIVFPVTAVGATSAAKAVTIENTGNTTLFLNSEYVTGTSASSYLKTSTTCGASLAVGASCTVSLEFEPTAEGPLIAYLAVGDNASGSPQMVKLSGTGSAPLTTFSPTSLTYATTTVGATSAAQTVTLSNTGNATLFLMSETITGAGASSYLKTGSTCGSYVTAGNSCTVSIAFNPAAEGVQIAYLSVADNAAGSPQTVKLSGTGSAPVVALSPTSLSFAATTVGTTSTAQMVTMKNTGNATLTLSSQSITGANASSFIVSSTTCGTSLTAGASCTISIEFQPTATGSPSAALSLVDNAAGSPQSVALSGTGQ